MTKVYVVTSGSYSDYHVVAIFSTPEAAKEYMDSVDDGDYNHVEEYDLNPNTTDLIRRGYSIWEVCMLRDGNTESVNQKPTDSYHVGEIGHRMWRRTEALFYKKKAVPDCLASTVWAKSEEHAIKIVNEQRIQMIANGKWDD